MLARLPSNQLWNVIGLLVHGSGEKVNTFSISVWKGLILSPYVFRIPPYVIAIEYANNSLLTLHYIIPYIAQYESVCVCVCVC